MSEQIDKAVWRVFDDSTVVAIVEQASMRLRAAADSSTALSWARRWWPDLQTHPGHVIVSAAAVHLVVIAAAGRPVGWQWTILPGIALALGAVLIALRRDRQGNR